MNATNYFQHFLSTRLHRLPRESTVWLQLAATSVVASCCCFSTACSHAQQPSDVGYVIAKVPEDASVFVNGTPTRSTGEKRRYYSRGLRPDATYAYELRVEVDRDGRHLEQSKTAHVSGGETVYLTFDFTRQTMLKPATPASTTDGVNDAPSEVPVEEDPPAIPPDNKPSPEPAASPRLTVPEARPSEFHGVVPQLTTILAPSDEPSLEAYLHSGQLAQGEQAFEAALAADPANDRLRFSLGMIQFVRAVERLGQRWYEHGVHAEGTNIPFLRVPVPDNDDPAPISYVALRRILDDFRRDLSQAQATLADIRDDRVKLSLRLADVRLDLDGDGEPGDKLLDVIKKVVRRDFGFLTENPGFQVTFDRGDVAWLRAYCHLLMAMLDLYLAFDTEEAFDLSAQQLFARPKTKGRAGEHPTMALRIVEPRRLARVRRHLLQVAALNRETWLHIRAETDDDHEWLPNPKQNAVFGLRVEQSRIDQWLAMMAEGEALLEGKRSLPVFLDSRGKRLNVKTLLENPPKVVDAAFPASLPGKYLSKEQEMNAGAFLPLLNIFQDPTSLAYAVWFN